MVLIKGMYEEHIKSEVLRLKGQRQRNKKEKAKEGAMHKSMLDQSRQRNTHSVPLSNEPHKKGSMNYSKLFHIKQQTTTKKNSTKASALSQVP